MSEYYIKCGQNKFLNEQIFKKKNGAFVDIGANDEITFSNTSFCGSALEISVASKNW